MTIYQPYERHAADFYIEPRSAVERLIAAERVIGTVLDPACGTGTIPDVFAAAGHAVMGSDIVNRRGADRWPFARADFLTEAVDVWPNGASNIISNPPYGLAERFLAQALQMASHKVAFLLRLAFLEGRGRAERIFNGRTPLKTVHVFPDRVNMPPGDKLLAGEVERKGGKHAFAWFVWEIGYDGRPEVRWL